MKVALIDDSRLILDRVLDELQGRMSASFEFRHTHTAEGFAAWFAKDPAHLTIVDLQIGHASGLEILKALQHYPCHCVVLSSSDSEPMRQAVFTAGAHAFFNKADFLDCMDYIVDWAVRTSHATRLRTGPAPSSGQPPRPEPWSAPSPTT